MKPIVRAVPVLVSVFALALFAPPARAQKETKPPVTYPELPSDIPTKFKPVSDSFDYTKRSEMIPMRDGVKLHTVLLIPKGAKKAPILLTRTPYSADKLTSHAESAHLGPVLHGYDNAVDVILQGGYIRVVQDVRGKHGSEGDYVVNRPLRGPLNKTPVDHATDTYDTIDWLVKNVSESNGKVGILGISYNGFLPLMALVNPHPALKVSVPMNPMVDGWMGDDWFHYGAFRQVNVSWIYNQVATRKGDAKWWRSHNDEYDMWMQAVSAGELGRRRGLDQLGFWNKLVEHPAYDAFWRDQALDKVLAEQPLKTPVMLVHSLWDQEDIYGAPAVYKAIEPKDTANDKVFLVIGPWHHGQMIGNGSSLGALKFGSDTALYFRQKILAPFLAQYLKDDAAKADIAPVTAFETGTNEWRRYSAWPPKTDEGKTGKMTPLYLRAGLKLSQTAPLPDDTAFEEYISDPAKPVPFCPRPIQPMGYEENNPWPRWLVNDQREASGRPDVVTFVSEVLTEPMKISGEPIANLVASTSGTDSDWVVKLIDVYPDEVGSDAVMGGYQLMIAADIFRGRYRESFAKAKPIAANTPLLYRFALPTANHVFLPGHRIMVQIQSSWFPLYDRNPQTFVPNILWAKPGDYRKAAQRIYHSGKERSFIELPLAAPTTSARGRRLGPSGTPLIANEPVAAAPKEQANAQQGRFPVPEMTPKRTEVKPFEYVDVGKKIPNYTPSRVWGVQGEPYSKMQVPLSAEESLKHLVVPKGFHPELFVSEEQLGGGKPICMNWDERGRLWVAMTYDYPNQLQQPGQGHDRIVFCEDTDGDGKADKVTVFAEKLSIPTSIFFARGGVIVFDAGRTIFLKDTDGDGKADVREVLFGTWNMRDTHGTASNMQYGLDNWIWGMQGYNRSRITLKNGEQTEFFNQGFFRFKEDGSKFEFIRSTDNNTWGLGISEEGIIFGSTANRNPSVYMPIPNRYYERVRGWTTSLQLHTIADSYLFKPIVDKVRQVDQHGGYTAAAGHSLYTARRYPKEYWNRTAFVAEPTGHLVGTFVIRRDSSHFRSNNSFNLVASDDEWTAPIMAEIGPDGNVWVIDWYNYIVQHNPTPIGFKTGKGAAYETDLRDKKYARIYRLVYDGPSAKESKERFTLADATAEKLVATLKNDNLFWRRHAQRLLVERGKQDVVPALLAMARDPRVDAIGLNVGVIHALWTLHGLGALDGSNAEATAVAVAALKHRAAGVRRNAVQVLPQDVKSVAAILDAGLTRDPDVQVRLMSLLALADQPPTPAAGEAIIAALSDPTHANDRWIPDAATSAAANNSETFLKALSAKKEPSTKMLAVAGIVAEHYARNAPVDSVGTVLASLVDADPQVIGAVVRGLSKGWPRNKPRDLDERAEQNLEKLIARLPPERRGELIKLTVAWGSKKFERLAAAVSRSLLAKVQDESLSAADRIAAARELAGYRSADVATVEAILEQITPRTPPEVAIGFLQALQGSEAAETGKLILERLPALTPATRAAGLAILLTRPEWTRALLASAEENKVRLVDLSLDQQRTLTEHPDRRIRGRARALLRRGGALPNPDRQKVLEEFLPIAKEKGDPVAGKAMFLNQCSKCHIHGTEGNRIGPDLTGMAVHPKDHLLTDVLDPSRSVEANFRAYTVTTKAGRIFTGLLASESKTTIELFDAEGKKQTILRQDLEELVATNKSLMPDGFEKLLSRKDLTDLLEFLTQRGKYLPLPLDKVATIVSTKGMLNGEESRDERLVFGDWKPKTFEGVPFHLVDPQGDRVPNVIMLYSRQGRQPPKMPKSVSLTCNVPAKAIHLLSGISGWGYSDSEKGTVSTIVRLHYADGATEDHVLKNGEQFAGYIRRVDVPGSKFAFNLNGRQVRYLAIEPKRKDKIERIEFVKGPDDTAPIVMAVTVEPLE